MLSVVGFYINNSIIDNFVEKNNISYEEKPVTNCVLSGIPTVDIKNLTRYSIINNQQSYRYSVDDIQYIIHPEQSSYYEVCSSFCTEGKNPLGDCKMPNENILFKKCENLLTPPSGCNLSSKPIVNVKDENGDTEHYYAVSLYSGS